MCLASFVDSVLSLAVGLASLLWPKKRSKAVAGKTSGCMPLDNREGTKMQEFALALSVPALFVASAALIRRFRCG